MKKNWSVKIDGRGMDSGEIISAIFDSRNVEDSTHFLRPNEDDLIPLDKLHNIDKAFGVIDNALNSNKKLMIIADTDCDGCTSGAIIGRYLSNFTDKISYYINEWKEHGVKNFNISCCDADVVIIVDSINSTECYDKFTNNGKKVVVLDHHVLPNLPEEYSEDVTIVSSANDYENPFLSGAGVVWKFCKYCDEMYLTDYADSLVDLAACGIIADMMDMTVPENRYICSLGLRNIQNLGLKKANGTYKFDSQAVSFGIAPLVNAANRLNTNELALKLFLSDDEKEIVDIVKQLKKTKERQNIIVDELMPMISEQTQNQINNKVLFFVIDTEVSVSGLVANKLSMEYQRPVLVVKKTENSYTGSARGYGVKDFRRMCEDCDIISQGHPKAFGVEITEENFEPFKQEINHLLQDVEFEETKSADVQIDLTQISDNLIDYFKTVNEISGEGFKPLSVLIKDIDDYEVGYMSGGKHLKITAGDVIFIKWNFQGSFEEFDGRPFSVIGGLTSGYFGKTYYKQVIIDDYRFEDGE